MIDGNKASYRRLPENMTPERKSDGIYLRKERFYAMLASQIIYTACGKTKQGDFDTWSKSTDITPEEEEEICTNMSYKRLPSHPKYPTEEEIREIFPKKFSYFMLSTGRYCLAMSTYVGKVYSDSDGRSGNYVMHGYVFDKPESLVPVNYFENKIFKSSFSYEDWHDADAPESLPRIEIPDSVDGISDDELREFFTPARLECLKLLVQAVRNSLTTDSKVTFNDHHANIPYWYKGISLCIPESLQNTLTFCTFYTPGSTKISLDPNAIDTAVKIRNVHPERPGSPQFIYGIEAADGNYAFDFEAGILPSGLTVTNFVDRIVEYVVSDTDSLKKIVEHVGEICDRCNVDPDTAINVSFLLDGDMAALNDDYSLIKSLIGIFERCYPDKLADTADVIYNYAIRDGHWELSSDIAYFYDFITENATVVGKSEMVELYLDNLEAFGVCECDNELDFCSSVKSCAPFSNWSYLEEYLLSNDGFKHCKELFAESSVNSFLIFHTYINALSRFMSNDEYKKKIALYVATEMRRAIQKDVQNNSTSEIGIRYMVIEAAGKNYSTTVIKNALFKVKEKSLDEPPLFEIIDKTFVLSIAERFCEKNAAIEIMAACVRAEKDSAAFLESFVELSEKTDKSKALYSAVCNELSNDSELAEFLTSVRLKKFERSARPDIGELEYYFDKCFIKGNDNGGAFMHKLVAKLQGSAHVIGEGIGYAKKWVFPYAESDDSDVKERAVELAKSIRACIVKAKDAEVKAYFEANGMDEFANLNEICADGFVLPDAFNVMGFYSYVICRYISAPHSENEEAIKAFKEMKEVFKNELTNALGYLLRWYMKDIMRLYLKLETTERFRETYEVFLREYGKKDEYILKYREAMNSFNKEGGVPEFLYLRMLYSTIVYDGICSLEVKPVFDQIINEEFKSIPKKHFKFVMTKLMEFAESGALLKDKRYSQIVVDYIAEYQKAVKESSFFGKIGKLLKKHEAADKKAQKSAQSVENAPEEQPAAQNTDGKDAE